MDNNNQIYYQTTSCGRYKLTTIVNGLLAQNCYVLTHKDTKEALVIDPGATVGQIQSVLESDGAQIQHVILTHAHFDHLGSAAELGKLYNVCIHMHDGDKRLLRMASIFALRFANQIIETPKKYSSLGNEQIVWAGDDIQTILTPGHTEGSVCYKIGRVCFTGDTLMQNTIGNSYFPGADFDKLINSVSGLLDILSSEIELYPGHGKPWLASEAKAWWMQAKHKKAKEFDAEGLL